MHPQSKQPAQRDANFDDQRMEREDFDRWARAVRAQMLECLRHRGSSQNVRSASQRQS